VGSEDTKCETSEVTPPKPSADWESAKNLYLAYVTDAEICQQLNVKRGALRSQISRGQWRRQRAALASTLLHSNNVKILAKPDGSYVPVLPVEVWSETEAQKLRRELVKDARAIRAKAKDAEPLVAIRLLNGVVDLLNKLERPAERVKSEKPVNRQVDLHAVREPMSEAS